MRTVVDENGDVEETYDYYPFGMVLRRTLSEPIGTIDTFTGKELDEEGKLDWYYFGARFYDAKIGRWMGVDPMADEYPGMSPYGYCRNNPVSYFDPDGKYILGKELKHNSDLKMVLNFVRWFSQNNPSVVQAFADLNTSVDDFNHDGIGPILRARSGQVEAGFYPSGMLYFDGKPNNLQTIFLSQIIIDNLSIATTHEEKKFYFKMLLKTILHETGHWAWITQKEGYTIDMIDWQNFPQEPSEQGKAIEMKIWGRVDEYDAGRRYDPLNNPEFNSSGEYNIDPFDMWLNMQWDYYGY